MAYGLLNVFKPSGPTSHDIVAAVRRGTGERRIGHAGTLDPLAEGVLVLALGKATRLIEYLSAARKEYSAALTLGITTDSYDTEGQTVTSCDGGARPTLAEVEDALAEFRGAIQQKPPVYSAIKIDGKPAHRRVRAGETVELAAREVTIYSAQIAAYDYPLLGIDVACSAGTYIRSLAHDLGQALGCGAALSKLVRTASGDFRAADSVRWDDLTRAFDDGSWARYLLPADHGAKSLPALTLDAESIADVLHGRAIRSADRPDGLCRAYSPDGELIAILTAAPADGLWHPHKVLADPASIP